MRYTGGSEHQEQCDCKSERHFEAGLYEESDKRNATCADRFLSAIVPETEAEAALR